MICRRELLAETLHFLISNKNNRGLFSDPLFLYEICSLSLIYSPLLEELVRIFEVAIGLATHQLFPIEAVNGLGGWRWLVSVRYGWLKMIGTQVLGSVGFEVVVMCVVRCMGDECERVLPLWSLQSHVIHGSFYLRRENAKKLFPVIKPLLFIVV